LILSEKHNSQYRRNAQRQAVIADRANSGPEHSCSASAISQIRAAQKYSTGIRSDPCVFVRVNPVVRMERFLNGASRSPGNEAIVNAGVTSCALQYAWFIRYHRGRISAHGRPDWKSRPAIAIRSSGRDFDDLPCRVAEVHTATPRSFPAYHDSSPNGKRVSGSTPAGDYQASVSA